MAEQAGALLLNVEKLKPESINNNCTFNGNIVKRNGSAIMLKSGHINIAHCDFHKNIAGNLGGSLVLDPRSKDLYCQLTECSFLNNTARLGGALGIEGAYLTMLKTTLMNNQARNKGGSIFQRNGKI